MCKTAGSHLFAYGGAKFTVFYGVGWVLRGYLIFRSSYLPKFLGVLITLGGLAFIMRNFLLVLTPAYAPGSLLLFDGARGTGSSRVVARKGRGRTTMEGEEVESTENQMDQ